MKAVVIGGGGFMGLSLTKALLKESYHVTVVDLFLGSFDSVVVDPTSYQFVQGSFLDTTILNNVLQDADVVFHLAAVGMSGKDEKNKDLIQKVNIDGVSLLLDQCIMHGVKRFIYASSCITIFTGETLRNASENDTRPEYDEIINYYGRSKAIAEAMISQRATDNFKTCCLRFRGIYGPGERNTTERVIKLIRSGLVVARCQKEDKIETQYTSIANCIQSFLISEKSLLKENVANGQIYHILDDEICGNYEFWAPLFLLFGSKLPTIRLPFCFVMWLLRNYEYMCHNFFNTHSFASCTEVNLMAVTNTFSTEKAKRELGYNPSSSMMPEVVKYYRDRLSEEPREKSSFCGHIFFLIPVALTIIVYLFVSKCQ